jgi:membrane protein implicated in regulation of membrane protease activity
MPWWLWVLIGVLALAGEAASMALFLLYVAVAAFAAALLALFGAGIPAEVTVFITLSVLLLGLVRPRMLQALAGRVPHRALTNQGLLVDRVGTVTQTVTADSGMIRIGTGEFWTARANPPTTHLDVGSKARIVYVSGLTAYVEPIVTGGTVPSAPGPAGSPELAREER